MLAWDARLASGCNVRDLLTVAPEDTLGEAAEKMIGTSSASSSARRSGMEAGSPRFFGRSVDEAVAALGPAAEMAGIPPERLAVDLAALWYPFAHEHTLLPTLGIKARDPAFLEEQKRHLGDLVRAMTRPERKRPSRRQRS
jgi:hypothetical protein